jgi:hypothetical protein
MAWAMAEACLLANTAQPFKNEEQPHEEVNESHPIRRSRNRQQQRLKRQP